MPARVKPKVPSRSISRDAFSIMPKAKVVSFEPSEMRLTPASRERLTVKAGTASTLTGLDTDEQIVFDRLDVGDARRIEHVGAGHLEGLQPPDRVVEVRTAPQKILGARGEDEVALQRARRIDRRSDPFDRQLEVVDRLFRIAGVILDRAAGQSGGLGGEDRLGRAVGAVALAALEIGRNRQVGRRDHFAAMLDHVSKPMLPSGRPREKA